MAVMIPNVDSLSIPNRGERLFYEAARELPADYSVFYSYTYRDQEAPDQTAQIGEADFVIVHPSLGFVVVEVKEGDIMYSRRTWYEYKESGYQKMKKDPVRQARKAMFAILNEYKRKAKGGHFPLQAKYALCFPDCKKVIGQLPTDIIPESIFLHDDLYNLEARLRQLFTASPFPKREAVEILNNKVLAPSFRLKGGLKEQMEIFEQQAQRILTDEQERILAETELDNRKLFLGAAGTGKTFLAIEKAKRLAAQGKKVFLTCFNRNLATYMRELLPASVTVFNFHDFLIHSLQKAGIPYEIPAAEDEKSLFFAATLPDLAFSYFAELPVEAKFDSLIVDEGQDFNEDWFICLEAVLKKDGDFYVFADPGQALFNKDLDFFKRFPISKQRLTRNLRNTEIINQWLADRFPTHTIKPLLRGGGACRLFPWSSPAEERKMVEGEVSRLVSQGIKPCDLVILSPNIKEKSSLAGMDRIKEWPLGDAFDTRINAVRFCTIRSFKGLEADIVLLIGIKEGTLACTPRDIYVGASRARFLLYIFHDRNFNLDDLG